MFLLFLFFRFPPLQYSLGIDEGRAVLELQNDIMLRCCTKQYCNGLKNSKYPCDEEKGERGTAARDKYGCPCEHEIQHGSVHSNQDTIMTLTDGMSVRITSEKHFTLSAGGGCRMFKVNKGAELHLNNVVIADTTQYASGAGIAINDGGLVRASKTTFRANKNNQHQGGAFFIAKGGDLRCRCVHYIAI